MCIYIHMYIYIYIYVTIHVGIIRLISMNNHPIPPFPKHQ